MLYNSNQLSLFTKYVPLVSEQFHVEWGTSRTSLMTMIPATAGAGDGEPGIAGGTGWAQPCPPVAEADRVVIPVRRKTSNAAARYRTLLSSILYIFVLSPPGYRWCCITTK